MAQTLLSRKYLKLIHIALLLFFFRPFLPGTAQSVLLPGDVSIVSLQAGSNEVSFIPLIDLEAGTQLYLSNGSWNDSTATLQGNEVRLEFQNALEAGSLIQLGSEDERLHWTDSLRFSGDTHRLFIYQKEKGMYRFIAAAGWGKGAPWRSGSKKSNEGSDIPESLTDAGDAILHLGTAPNYQYYIRNGASGTAGLLRSFVYDEANWRGSSQPFPAFRTSFNLLAPPVILFEQSHTSVSESDSQTVLNVAIYEHDGSRLSVDVIFDSMRSTASMQDFRNLLPQKTINFTGLIGDGVYEVAVPLQHDEVYESKETAIFRLDNLTKGNFGDFLTHSLIINEEKLPDVELIANSKQEQNKPALVIRNNESMPVHLKDWMLKSGRDAHVFAEETKIEAGQMLDWELSEHEQLKAFVSNHAGRFQLLSPEGKVASTLSVSPAQIQDADEGKQQQPLAVKSLSDSNSSVNNTRAQRATTIPYADVLARNGNDGWFATRFGEIASAAFTPEKIYRWNAETGKMEEHSAEQLDALGSETPVFLYLDEEGRSALAEQAVNKEKSAADKPILTATVAAADHNDNGYIDGVEGMNLFYNHTQNRFTASEFIERFQQQNPEVAVAPTLYGVYQNNRGAWVYRILAKEAVIMPGMAFWVEIEESLEQAELSVSFEAESTQVQNEAENTAVSERENLQLLLSHKEDSLQQNVDILLYEEAAPADKKDLNFYEPLLLPAHQQFKAAIKKGKAFVAKTSVPASGSQAVTLPVWVQGETGAQYSLSVEGFDYLPRGWTVQIEDVHTGRTRNFMDDAEEFSFLFEEDAASLSGMSAAQDTLGLQAVHRFNLVLSPPAAQSEEPEEQAELPRQIELHQNYPNPFNPVTTISFYLPKPERVRLSVFNIVGQPIAVLAEGTLSAGEKHFEWDATDKPSGMYIYQLEVGNKVMTRKMTLVK